MKFNFSSVLKGICCAGIISVIMAYFNKKREEKLMRQSFDNLRDSLQTRAEMDRRVNFYYNNQQKESE